MFALNLIDHELIYSAVKLDGQRPVASFSNGGPINVSQTWSLLGKYIDA